MTKFKLNEYTHPADIFQFQENLRATREWARREEIPPTPKVEKVEKRRESWTLFLREILP
jgi:hypothetical protein